MWKAVDDSTGEILGHVVLERRVPGSGREEEVEKVSEDYGRDGDVHAAGGDEEEEKLPEGLRPDVATAVGRAVEELHARWVDTEHFRPWSLSPSLSMHLYMSLY